MNTLNTTLKIAKYEVHDVVRSKWVVLYGAFFLLLTEGILRFGGGEAKALLSLVNVVLLLIPLVSLLFGTLYVYHSRAFIERLLSQPLPRTALFGGFYLGLVLPLALGFLFGTGLPFVWHGLYGAAAPAGLAFLLVVGVLLTGIFLALAVCVALRFEDRLKGIGTAFVLWLALALLYDGLVLVLIQTFSAYPLEKPMLALMLLNPIDLARIALLLQFDIAALMGYTGAVFQDFFGSSVGVLSASAALLAWLVVPLWGGWRLFLRKDF